ncbi:MAG: proline--tRNA ligase [Clostridia bacterium]
MKLDKLVGDRFKEKPADCVIDSHALMLRGGYMKFVASGIFSQYMPLRRICRKIEQIIREEMDAIDGQEVQFPVALPASLWEESGRYESVGSELLRFTDRNAAPMVLGMTHEEAAVQLVREYGISYTRYPFMIYQIQTKFRDEARPRAGLIRVREFTMKDAYSFHTSQEDLERYYQKCYDAYNRIFARAGIPEVVTVQSDSGMMGGNVSHEYMLLTPVGEDTIALCTECDYRANMEAAENIVENDSSEAEKALEMVETPQASSIEAVCSFLKMPLEKSCKAVVYQKNMTGEYIIVFLRGDLEVNETKLRNFVGEEIHPGEITEESGITAGFIGPYGLDGSFTIVYDKSLAGTKNLCCGANRKDYHYRGFNIERDCGAVEFADVAKIREGGICPCCGKHTIKISRGIEVGNIFQLGTKYTKTMGMQYLDQEGNLRYPIMGCYGIGVGRLAASVCEAHRDEYGPIWPISIAPWQVHICCLRSDDQTVKSAADDIYRHLQEKGVEAIYDDRDVRAGVMFSDADLLGVPVRIVVSPRSLGENLVELSTRDKKINQKVPKEEIVSATCELIENLKKEIEEKV